MHQAVGANRCMQTFVSRLVARRWQVAHTICDSARDHCWQHVKAIASNFAWVWALCGFIHDMGRGIQTGKLFQLLYAYCWRFAFQKKVMTKTHRVLLVVDSCQQKRCEAAPNTVPVRVTCKHCLCGTLGVRRNVINFTARMLDFTRFLVEA